MSDVIKSVSVTDSHVIIHCTIADPTEMAQIAIKLGDNHHIGGLLLPSRAKTTEHADGTYTHTYVFHPLRYIDPRITHTQDDRQAGPL